MKGNDLASQLTNGQKLEFSEQRAVVVDKFGKSIAEFIVSIGGELTAVDPEAVKSKPPSGWYRVKNLAVDPKTGKFWVEYDDTPC